MDPKGNMWRRGSAFATHNPYIHRHAHPLGSAPPTHVNTSPHNSRYTAGNGCQRRGTGGRGVGLQKWGEFLNQRDRCRSVHLLRKPRHHTLGSLHLHTCKRSHGCVSKPFMAGGGYHGLGTESGRGWNYTELYGAPVEAH